MDTNTVAEQAPSTAPGFEYFEHAERLLELMDELDREGGEDQFQLAMRARGWDLAVELHALGLHTRGVDLRTIAQVVVRELRAALRGSGHMDACDEALLLLAEYRIAASSSVRLTASNEVVDCFPSNMAALNAQRMGGFASEGDVRHFGWFLRDVVRDMACKAEGGENAEERAVGLVGSFAQRLLAAFTELEAEVQS